MRWGKSEFTNYERGIEREWLISNGRSAFAGSTIIGANSRKYHSLLNACFKSPNERFNILSKVEESLVIGSENYELSTTKYENKILEGYKNLQSFSYEGIPSYRYFIKGTFIDKRITMDYGHNTTVIEYNIKANNSDLLFKIAPCLSFREPGAEGKEENLAFNCRKETNGFILNPLLKKNLKIKILTDCGKVSKREAYVSDRVIYDKDKGIGDPYKEAYYIPGELEISINKNSSKKFYLVVTTEVNYSLIELKSIFRSTERRINELRKPFKKQNRPIEKYLPLGADNFIVHRDSTNYKTILAGYPWFLDWGRDTMVAFTGLVLCTKRFEDGRNILRSFTYYEKNGLIPNMFPDNDQDPIYNTVDASLWYIHCIYMYLLYSDNEEEAEFVKKELYGTAKNIIKYYIRGTDFSIKILENGLLSAGSGFDQVTWMDVRVGEIVVTPRHGCPVEVNALWYNALKIMFLLSKKFKDDDYYIYESLSNKVKKSFNKEFWYEDGNYLYDVVDREKKDQSLRPNQVWTLSLPFTMLPKEKEVKVLNKVLEELYTPYGLRSLNRGHDDYKGNYEGELFKRDMAYHQDTVWSFPLGGFFTAYCKVNNYSKEAIDFVNNLLMDMETHIENGCVGNISEIFDGESPHKERGCFAQAWGIGEILRVYHEDILGNHKALEKSKNNLFK